MDVSDREVLKDIAVGTGLDGDEVDGWLGSNQAAGVVDGEARRSKEEKGSVPRFFIQGVYRVEGAGDPGEFMEIFAKVKEAEGSFD